jgi:hypothetical protein
MMRLTQSYHTRALVPTPRPAPPTGPSKLARYSPTGPDLHPIEICYSGVIEAGDDRGRRGRTTAR